MTSIYTFWILLSIILYCYIGYTLILLISVILKRFIKSTKETQTGSFNFPDVSIVIAAFNEKEIVESKIQNTNSLNYPTNRITQIWVTDGSNDGTPELLKTYPNITVLHYEERLGKASAINHAMEHVTTPITIFSDANTMLSPNAIIELVKPFQNPKVGCVAGEKQINLLNQRGASSTGEGIYWKYESFIKQLESNTGSTLSAAGELFAIKTELFQKLETNTILDDFETSTQIALKGYSVIYSKNAIATENGSLNFDEERKRKIRIAAGGFQTLFRRTELLNITKNFQLSFKYISHKVLRWTIVPIAILTLPVLNIYIVTIYPNQFYVLSLATLLLLYGMAILGHLLKNNRINIHLFYLPYYFIMMQIAEIQGFLRFLNKTQDAKWEKAKRET